MSKAFTRESDHDADEESPRLRIPPGTRNYLTPAGYARLKHELDTLWKLERPKLVEIIAWAASNGDRSENGDYIYGKKRLREIDRRIRFLSKRLEIAEVVDPSLREDTEQVFFGATVTVCDQTGMEQTIAIVGVDEADAARGRISWISPMARVLIRARAGDTVRLPTPTGMRTLEILEVSYVVLD